PTPTRPMPSKASVAGSGTETALNELSSPKLNVHQPPSDPLKISWPARLRLQDTPDTKPSPRMLQLYEPASMSRSQVSLPTMKCSQLSESDSVPDRDQVPVEWSPRVLTLTCSGIAQAALA